MDKKYLKEILDYALILEDQGHSSLMFVQRELITAIPKKYEAIDKELLELPLHLYSSVALLHLVTVSYYYKDLLLNRPKFFDKVFHELIFVRGMGELEEPLNVLK